MSDMARRYALLLLGALVGCAGPPTVPPFPSGNVDGGARVFADTVIAYSTGGQLTSCLTSLPQCGDLPPPCGPNAVLGANDGNAFTLGANDKIELGFRCNVINVDGIEVWAQVPAGASAVVEVSQDGTSYKSIGVLDSSNKSFSLTIINWFRARFVRISDQGTGGIAIDAVEALQ
jgi:hypothetical protein